MTHYFGTYLKSYALHRVHLFSFLIVLFHDFGFYTSSPSSPIGSCEALTLPQIPTKVPFYVFLSVTRIYDVKPVDESFELKVALYINWPLDFDICGVNKLIEDEFGDIESIKSSPTGYVSLNFAQIEKFNRLTTIPEVKFFNALSIEESNEGAGIRLFPAKGGFVFWNKAYVIKFHKDFNLKDFPFDTQDLHIELLVDHQLTRAQFTLVFVGIQFFQEALEMSEWVLLKPHLPPTTFGKLDFADVCIRIMRRPSYYVHNMVGMMALLSGLSLIVFIFELSRVSDRIQITLTLMLTAVTFKFALSDSLPRVPYHTFIDKFVLMVMVEFSVTTVVCALPRVSELSGWLNRGQAKILDLILMGFCTAMALLPKLSWCMQALHKLRTSGHAVRYDKGKASRKFYLFRFSEVYFLPSISTPTVESSATPEDEGDLVSPLSLPRMLSRGMRSVSQIVLPSTLRTSLSSSTHRWHGMKLLQDSYVVLSGMVIVTAVMTMCSSSMLAFLSFLCAPLCLWLIFSLFVLEGADIYSVLFGWMEDTHSSYPATSTPRLSF